MTDISHAETRSTYRPTTLMNAFVTELETYANGSIEISDDAFQKRLDKAYQLAKDAYLGGGSKLYFGIGEICGVKPATVKEWTRGKDLPNTQAQRRLVLRELCKYLKTRYR